MKFKKALLGMLVLSALTSASFYQVDKNPELIQDETTVTNQWEDQSFVIETASEKIYQRIAHDFGRKAIGCHVTTKTDLNGPYKEYALRFRMVDRSRIVSAIEKY